MSEQRLGILEQRVEHVVDAVEKIDTKVDSITETLRVFARIEERQMVANDKLVEGAATMKNHEERLRDIEVALPQLKEVRRWVVSGVLSGIGLMMLALGHTVLK